MQNYGELKTEMPNIQIQDIIYSIGERHSDWFCGENLQLSKQTFTFFFWEKVSCIPGCPQIPDIAKNKTELLILCPLLPECWDYKAVLLQPFQNILVDGIQNFLYEKKALY